MPQFLTTSGTSHYIEHIIRKAKSELVLITPYLKLSRILSERLAEANQLGVRIKLVYGKSELKPSERKQLDTWTNLELLYLENLHAKCYYNESTLIVSSMNLYEFSEKNNREMGILLTRSEDGECFTDALAEAQSILTAARAGSKLPQQPVAPVAPAESGNQSTPLASSPRELDRALTARKVFERLKQQAPAHVRFHIRQEPNSFNAGFRTIVSAEDYPRRGIRFEFNGTIRFDFANSREYQTIKEKQREPIDRLLANYRCYWNRDVIQIYGANGQHSTDEQAEADYQIRAIEQVAQLLQPFRL